MNLDKHDLFRNAVPGFVFLVVVLSFYAVTERIDNINDTQKAIVLFVAGFPLGFIIHSIYRIVFHIGGCCLSEQKKMEEKDAKIMRGMFCENEKMKELERKYSDCSNKNKVLSLLLLFSLSEEKNKEWKNRIDFLFSYLHSLGSSILSIVMALAFMCWIKFHILLVRPWKTWFLTLMWGLIILIFYYGTRKIKFSCELSKELFVIVRKREIEELLNKKRIQES